MNVDEWSDRGTERSKSPRSKWGAVYALFFGLVLFFIPQFFLGIVLGLLKAAGFDFLDRIIAGDDIALNFIFVGVAELITLGFLWLVLYVKRASFADLGFMRKGLEKLWYVLPGFGVYFLMTSGLVLLASSFLSEETLQQEQELGFSGAAAPAELVLSFIALVIIAPFVEEMLFRGFVFAGMRRSWGFVPALLVSSTLFAFAHAQINVGIDTFALAIVLGWIYHKTDNLWPSIGLHMLKNLIAFLFVFVIDLPT